MIVITLFIWREIYDSSIYIYKYKVQYTERKEYYLIISNHYLIIYRNCFGMVAIISNYMSTDKLTQLNIRYLLGKLDQIRLVINVIYIGHPHAKIPLGERIRVTCTNYNIQC